MKKSSNTCKLMKNGNCGGVGCRNCNDYEPIYIIPKEEMALWPGERDRSCKRGINYKSQSARLRGEYVYSGIDTYFSFY